MVDSFLKERFKKKAIQKIDPNKKADPKKTALVPDNKKGPSPKIRSPRMLALRLKATDAKTRNTPKNINFSPDSSPPKK